VLAIEMESKGIGNTSFFEGAEWFAVRGISDYGDRHVDDTWRRYASMAAAAYVRALLGATPSLDRFYPAGPSCRARAWPRPSPDRARRDREE